MHMYIAAGTGGGRLPWSMARDAKPWASAPTREGACACGGCAPALAGADAPPAERVCRPSPRRRNAFHGRRMRGSASARGIQLPMRSGTDATAICDGRQANGRAHTGVHTCARAHTHEHKQGTDNLRRMDICSCLEIRRTGAHGLRVSVALAGCVVEEEASYTDSEPKASRRQTSDYDSAAVRHRRRARRFLAFCWT